MGRVKVTMLGLRLVRERTLSLPSEYVRHAEDASAVASKLIGDKPVEFLLAILLNGRGQITGVATLSQGGMTGAGVRVADVLRTVLAGHAHAFVLAHNHPSGDPTPSAEDVEFTRTVAAGARTVGVALLDHVVVTADGSFRSIPVVDDGR